MPKMFSTLLYYTFFYLSLSYQIVSRAAQSYFLWTTLACSSITFEFSFHSQLNSNWFPSDEASLRRSHIQNLIYDIFENGSLKAPPIDCRGKGPLSELPGVIEHKVEADSSGASCYPGMWHGNLSNGSTETDIQFRPVSPVRAASCSRDPGIVFKDLQAAVVPPHFDCRQMSLCHQSGFLSPIEVFETLQ